MKMSGFDIPIDWLNSRADKDPLKVAALKWDDNLEYVFGHLCPSENNDRQRVHSTS